MDSEPAARASPVPGWRSAGSPLFAEESYLGGINVLDPRQALHLPCRVTGLTVQGNERTRREMIEREMRAAMGARTHAELAAGASIRSDGMRSCSRRARVKHCARATCWLLCDLRHFPGPRPRRRAWDRALQLRATSTNTFRPTPLCAELLNAKGRLYDLDVFREATCHVDVGERDEVLVCTIMHSSMRANSAWSRAHGE